MPRNQSRAKHVSSLGTPNVVSGAVCPDCQEATLCLLPMMGGDGEESLGQHTCG